MKRLIDPLIALALAAGYVALLLATVAHLGYARDEGFYFQAARSYGAWFDLLRHAPDQAMLPANVDRYWSNNSEHPAFVKSLFALSDQLFYQKLHWFSREGTAFRFPGMVLSGLAVGVTYLWGKRSVGRLAGFVAALSFAMMPRVFYHAHLDCFDMPVTAMWLFTVYAYFRSCEEGGGIGWALATGVLYGLLLDTKHNSWLLPPALIAHFVIVRGPRFWRELRVGRISAPLALVAMALIGPVVFYALWPWIWHDTGARLAAYVAFHTGHEYYNMEFLGRTYWKPPMPLGYAWVMTAATVPAVTLILAGIGLFWAGLRAVRVRGVRLAKKLRLADVTSEDRRAFSAELLWILCILVSYGPWLSEHTPIFGGTKHWLTAYPFLCLFAARGFELGRGRLRDIVKLPRVALDALFTVCVVAAPIAITLHSQPWGLSSYTPLVGGAPGGATLGLNRTFWGYTTGSVADWLNAHVPANGSVYIHDTAGQSWDQMVRDGMIRRDIRSAWLPSGASFAIYHHEPHMGRVEYQEWVALGTTSPAFIGVFDGVPVVWVYAKPGAAR
jgi:4-amino-4-deoxy-L-arabinose transferase-like glycosyltransferase